MSSSVSNLQLLNNTEHRVKFKTGSDINNVLHSFNNIIPDLGSGGNNGTLVNGNEGQNQYTNFPERSDDVPDAANKYSVTSVMFDGVNDYMDTGVSIIEDTSALSMSAWVFLNSAPADYDQVVAIRGYGAYPGAVGTARALGFYEGKLHFNTFDSLVQGTTVLSTGNWYHIAGTVTSDGTAKVYLNGVLEGSGTVTMNPINNQNTFTAAIGATTEYIPAKIDEVSLWDSVLTDGGVSVGETAEGDIAKLYNNGNPNDISALNPLGWWRMGEHLCKDPLVGEMLVETSRHSDISFNGINKRDTDYTFGGGEFSLSAWINTTKEQFIIATDSPSGQGDTSFAIGFKDSTTPYVLVGNPGQQIYKTGSVTAINDGNWHNVIVTIDSSYVMNFYIDGVLETTHTFSILPGASDYLTHLGNGWLSAISTGVWGLNGQLNGLGIWERVLTDKEINTISSSGRYSPSPSHFSPDLWVGSTDPALYTCTNTSGTISKVADLTAKMGDVSLLRTNSNEFTPNTSSHLNLGFSYSFWFYDDGTKETGADLLIYHDVTGGLDGGSQNSYVAISYTKSEIEFRQHVVRGNATFHNSSVAAYGGGNAVALTYEKNKLNNILITKEATSPNLTKFYFNGELVAECTPNAGYYPGKYGFQSIRPQSFLIGDFAYWDTDVSSISDKVYSPNEGHKGFQGDWRNLSIPPKHYWKFGAPMDSGEVKDLGTDGTNHFTPDTVASNQYEYKNIFGIDRSTE